MLKLTYTEDNLTLEYLQESLSEWVNTRVLLSLKSQTNFYMQNGTASFILPVDILSESDLTKLKSASILEICVCDRDAIEISLKGIWMSSQVDNHEGVFVTEISEAVELFLQRLDIAKQLCYL